MLRGIAEFTYLLPTTRLFFSSGAVLVVTNENLPCRISGDSVQAQYPEKPHLCTDYIKQAVHRRGIIACVEMPGDIAMGDGVRVEPPRNWGWLKRLQSSAGSG